MPDSAQGSFSAGDMIAGRFRVDRLIGRGGMGEVYAAKNVGTGREVALKIIRGAADPEQTRRFIREAKAATAIQHPNVIEVLDVFEAEDGTPVMVMELLRGEPFSALRKRKGALPLHEVARVLVPITAALRAAHEKGIVHRDLKPDNIFLAEGPIGVVPKVLDFGIAKVLDPTSISSETQGGNTSTGSILGTPHYMSFEQAMSEKNIDHRADIWAIGVMIFEALTGRRPLVFENLGEMYTAFLQRDVPSIRAALPDVPADVADVVDRCLHKQRDGRLDDLQPVGDVLGRYLDPAVEGAGAGGKVIDVLPTAETPTPQGAGAMARTAPLATEVVLTPAARPRGLLVIGGIVVTAALAVGFFAMWREPAPVSTPRSPQPEASGTASATAVEVRPAAPSATASAAPPEPTDRAASSAAPSAKAPQKLTPGPARAPVTTATAVVPKTKGIIDQAPY